MSERILKALMQMFALLANPVSSQNGRLAIVESFLKQQLNTELVKEYLKIYDDFYEKYQKRNTKSKRRKIISVSAVKILTICTLLNEELTQKEKIIVLIRILEFVNSDGVLHEQEEEFIEVVAESFNVSKQEFEALKHFIIHNYTKEENAENVLIINSKKDNELKTKHIFSSKLEGEITIFYIKSVGIHIFSFKNEKELFLNQQLLSHNKIHILTDGSAIRNAKINPIYYSDIISTYNYDKKKSQIVFEVDKIVYKFKNGYVGVQEFEFVEKSGNLIGIMGGSGSGKTTLLNVLNGSLKPSSGNILINGIDLHKEPQKLEGLIGYVSQDDLLMEDLTVYENLYYNAKLCFADKNIFSINRIVFKLLKDVGLFEIKDMKVGTPLNKKISGGQRKRLNIALEIIRESPILFLDEPTSGLSSRDSENVLDLLKQLALKGKLVFVVIHQPSSEIFKMFNKLLVLDQGGHLVYNGPPVESLIYFKTAVGQANWTESECHICGNVNAEQIFNIIESNVVDEFGHLTQTRKVSPEEWKEKFQTYKEQSGRRKRRFLVKKLPEIPFKIPNKFKQFKVFVSRDILSKLSNIQYMVINFSESAVLALILSFIIRYYNINDADGYSFFKNDNIPVYIFMSVIVALFVGLTVSSQEIIKDRKILKRESFLNLSKSSYLMSKVIILLSLSAFQAFSFVIIGNTILEIKGMFFEYWLVLFSTWSFANLLGLNISDGFKSTVAIYILIPFLIIPQIALSGVLIRFDKLNPSISSQTKIPIYGEIITARWAYEALAVNQFKNNEFYKKLYPYYKQKSDHLYYSFWTEPLFNNIAIIKLNINNKDEKEKVEQAIDLIRNELQQPHKWNNEYKVPSYINNLYYDKITNSILDSLKQHLTKIKNDYEIISHKIDKARDEYIDEIKHRKDDIDIFVENKKKYHNEQLENFVKGDMELNVIEYKGKIYRKYQPIYYDPEQNLLKAHFYAPTKRLFGQLIETFWVNIFIIWLQIIFLYLTLYFNILRKSLELFGVIQKTIKKQREDKKNKKGMSTEITKKKKRKRQKFAKIFR